MNAENNAPDPIDQIVLDFVKLSSKYFHFLENAENFEVPQIQEFLYTISPVLYAKGALFPETEMPDDEGNERFVTEEEWEKVFQMLRSKWGKLDKITFIDYKARAKEPITGSLAELFADVYQDLKDFSLLVSKPTLKAQTNAIYEIKKLFKTHWGPRLLIAQQLLHMEVFKNIEEE